MSHLSTSYRFRQHQFYTLPICSPIPNCYKSISRIFQSAILLTARSKADEVIVVVIAGSGQHQQLFEKISMFLKFMFSGSHETSPKSISHLFLLFKPRRVYIGKEETGAKQGTAILRNRMSVYTLNGFPCQMEPLMLSIKTQCITKQYLNESFLTFEALERIYNETLKQQKRYDTSKVTHALPLMSECSKMTLISLNCKK
ncbi:hypothetical protein BD560DRAFT_419436 [Blakeslea trispora]|nr:hypothetical protein BD560DRAFT_419436 [Blakeslea trispora]